MNPHHRISPKGVGAATLAALLLLPAPLFAHVGAGPVQGVLHGFAHPLVGLDHLVAMVAVGLWAAQRGGRAVWALPSAFVAVMVLAGAMGMNGLELPAVELAILGSVFVLGVLVAFAASPSLGLSMGAVALFALFHGHAHGAEMPQAVGGLAYAAGFAGATLLLHAAGVAVGSGLQRVPEKRRVRWARVAGGLICFVGAAYGFL